ncbi:MAG TPA: hypothetical protein VHE81_05115 [Lacipirellulaceae bacterium]|nr:hypothetical protein [Lacipirellulaceae bacterium]
MPKSSAKAHSHFERADKAMMGVGEARAEPFLEMLSAWQEPRPPGFETDFNKADSKTPSLAALFRKEREFGGLSGRKSLGFAVLADYAESWAIARAVLTSATSVATMKRLTYLTAFGLFSIALAAVPQFAWSKETTTAKPGATGATAAGSAVDFFDAVDAGQIKAKFIAKNDHAARLVITNNTKQPLHLKLPEAFVGVPVAAQFGGAGGGGRVGGGGVGRTSTGGGNPQQSVGGGLGGGGGGGLGGGGGFFSVPPEKSEKLDFPVLCLNHGQRDPLPSSAYKIVPAQSVLDRPAVIELLKAFGRGELEHAGAQAAAWHLNNDLTWNQLAAQLQGTRRSLRRPPYFSTNQLRDGMAYAETATRLAAANADQYKRAKQARTAKPTELEHSEAKSTTDTPANEPVTNKASENKDGESVSSK